MHHCFQGLSVSKDVLELVCAHSYGEGGQEERAGGHLIFLKSFHSCWLFLLAVKFQLLQYYSFEYSDPFQPEPFYHDFLLCHQESLFQGWKTT